MRDIFEQLRTRAMDDELADLTGAQLRNVLRGMPPSKAQGVDALSPPDLLRLPDEALESFAELLNQCEPNFFWPQQFMLTIGAILPKPKEGDRIIGLLPLQAKVWSRARGTVTDGWAEGLNAFWDTAKERLLCIARCACALAAGRERARHGVRCGHFAQRPGEVFRLHILLLVV